MDKDMIIWLVEVSNIHVITAAFNREAAKRNAHSWIGGDKEQYIVSPLTEPGDRIHVSLTLYV